MEVCIIDSFSNGQIIGVLRRMQHLRDTLNPLEGFDYENFRRWFPYSVIILTDILKMICSIKQGDIISHTSSASTCWMFNLLGL